MNSKHTIQLTQPALVIALSTRPVRFTFTSGELPEAISRRDIANVATALCAATPDPAVREGVRLLAVAIGLEVER